MEGAVKCPPFLCPIITEFSYSRLMANSFLDYFHSEVLLLREGIEDALKTGSLTPD